MRPVEFAIDNNVLIYPYWNVNINAADSVPVIYQVLIYPYWNVNARGTTAPSAPSGFNLSILECKFVVFAITSQASQRFNLSILECK